MKKFLFLAAFATTLAANAVVVDPQTTPEQTTENTPATETTTPATEIDDANQYYNFVQCVGTHVLLRKGPGKNYAYYKYSNGRPIYANEPDEFEYLGVTKNNYHKIRLYNGNYTYVAWISASYSFRY